MSDHNNSKTFYQFVPCGKCAACLTNRANQWTFRLEKELENSENPCYFVTLTYDDDHLPWTDLSPTVCRRDVQLFFKRLRKVVSSRLRYFLTSEYGEEFGRPHYHMILFNFDSDPVNIERAWQNGFVRFGSVTAASIRYVTKYFVTPQEVIPSGSLKPFSLSSKGLGLSYLTPSMVNFIGQHRDRPFLLSSDGDKVSFPRYFRKKLPFALELDNTANQFFEDFSAQYPDFHPLEIANRWNCDVQAKNYVKNVNRKKSKDI